MKLPDPDDLLYLGQIYGGDHETGPDGKEYWRFVVATYKKETYVLENHPSYDENGKFILIPIVKRLHDSVQNTGS